MYIVKILYDGETRIWLSERAQKELIKRKKKQDQTTAELLTKLKDCATNGFKKYTNSRIIKYEWDDVWRIGHGRLRLIGFYENNHEMTDFIGIDVFLKRGQALSPSQRTRIDQAAAIKKQSKWRRSDD